MSKPKTASIIMPLPKLQHGKFSVAFEVVFLDASSHPFPFKTGELVCVTITKALPLRQVLKRQKGKR